MQPEVSVLVIGAGVGGAALGLALGHGGVGPVVVIDRRSGPGNINRGDSLLPAVTAHLKRWGALPALLSAGARPVGKMQVYHGRDGLLFEAPLHSPEAPYLVLPHPQIERVLAERAAATGLVEVCYRHRLSQLIEEGGRVVGAKVVDPDGVERCVRARLVVGADGASSMVRAGLGIPLRLTPYRHAFFIADVDRPPGYEDAMRIELHPDGGVLVVPQGDDTVGLGVLVHPRQRELFRAGTMEEKLAAIGQRSPLLMGRRLVRRGTQSLAHLYALSLGHAPCYGTRGAVLIGDAIHVTNPTAGQGMTMAIEDAEALARLVGPVLRRSMGHASGAGSDSGAGSAGAGSAGAGSAGAGSAGAGSAGAGSAGAGSAGAGDERALDQALMAYERERRPRNALQLRASDWMSRFYAMEGPLGDRLRESLFRLGATAPGALLQRYLWSRMATRAGA